MTLENVAEEQIKALQVMIAFKQGELDNLHGWNLLKRRKLRREIKDLHRVLVPLLKNAQGIRQ